MRPFKVVISDYSYESLENEKAVLSQIDTEIFDYQCKTEDELITVASDCDALIVQFAPVTRRVIENLKNCKVIVRYAIGMDIIDIKAATEHGIYVANVPDYGIDEVSNHAICLLLALIRKLPQAMQTIKEHKWDCSLIKPLHRTLGKRLGLIGLGRIPSDVAKKLSGFGFEIVSFDPYIDKKHADELNVQLVSFDELIETSEFISIHCPLTDDTRGLFNRDVFKRMKNSAIIINTARGPIINENDLIDALINNEIGAAAIDVSEKEPIDYESPLLSMPNVIVTPHIAWYTEESNVALQTKAAQEVLRVLKGDIPKNLINKELIK